MAALRGSERGRQATARQVWNPTPEVRGALELRHQTLQVVGLDDAYTGHARREEAVKGLRKNLPTLGLSHIAEEADGLWRYGVPLVLSGHTHGGQVTVAKLHEFVAGRIAG